MDNVQKRPNSEWLREFDQSGSCDWVLGLLLVFGHLELGIWMPVRCTARSIIRWHNSGKEIPAAAAALGNKLVSVIPGRVLTSSTTASPFDRTITSTRP